MKLLERVRSVLGSTTDLLYEPWMKLAAVLILAIIALAVIL